MRTHLCLLLALLAPCSSLAATTIVDSEKELAWLTRQKTLDGSVVIRVPGLTTLSLPKLAAVTERLEIAVPGLVSVSLPALRTIGTDLNVGCSLHPREQWEDIGPLAPLPPTVDDGPNFADGPGASTKAAPQPSAPAALTLPRLTSVGGSVAVCSPGLLGVSAPKLDEVGRDLQLFAGPSWTSVDLPALKRVRSTLFLWLDGPTLTVTAGELSQVGAALQGGGEGTLSLDLPALEITAGIALRGWRSTVAGEGERPSLTLTALHLPALSRASQMVELVSIGGLTQVDLPALHTTASLRVDDLPELSSMSFPLLTSIERSVTLHALPALVTLGMDALGTVTERLQIGGLGMANVELAVQTVGSLMVVDQRCATLTAPTLRSAGSILLSGMGLTDRVTFAALERVDGPLHVVDFLGASDDDELPVLASDDETARVFEAPRLQQVGETQRDGLILRGTPFTHVRLPMLTTVMGPLKLRGMPALTQVDLPRLTTVGGALSIGESSRLVALSFPALRQAQLVELVTLTALKRVVATRINARVTQASGTRVDVLDVGIPE